MKITNKKRFITMSTISILIIMFIITLLSNQTFSHGEYKTQTICVASGDTLWNIALTQQKDNTYYENASIRDIVEDLKKINNLDNSYIYEGQKIEIPYL